MPFKDGEWIPMQTMLREENERLRAMLRQLKWYQEMRKNWSDADLLEMIFSRIELDYVALDKPPEGSG